MSATRNETVLLKKLSEETSDRSYLAGLNEGFLLEWKPENCNTSSVPEYSFRHDYSGNQCSPILSFIGESVKTIQNYETTRTRFNCQYYLLPSIKKKNEALYLMTGGDKSFTITYDNAKTLTGTMIALSNWTSVDFDLHYEGYYHNSWNYKEDEVQNIVAVATNKSCLCNNKNVELSQNGKLELQSPGFPDFQCPSAHCEYHISFPKSNTSNAFVQRTLITINAQSRAEVYLRLVTGSLDIGLNNNMFKDISTSFLVEQNEMKLVYSTPKQFHVGQDGHFKITIENVEIENDCDCSLFNQKKYQSDWTRIVTIPSHCKMMFCDWAIAKNSGYLREITVSVDHSHSEDEFHIWNSALMEKYKGNQLQQPRKVVISDGSSDTHIFFRRSSVGPKSIIHVSWRTVRGTVCPSSSTVLLDTQPQAFISPRYPMDYNFHGNCSLLLTAPENHYITVKLDDLEVKNIHDYLSFYDGNSTSSNLIEHLTGKKRNLTILSSGNMIFINFFSDGFDGRRGYHYVAFAVPKTSITEDPEDLNDSSVSPLQLKKENVTETVVDPEIQLDSNYSSINETNFLHSSESIQGHVILHFICSVLILVAIALIAILGAAVFKKKTADSNRTTSFANEMVRFHNEDTGSTVTIGNNA